MNQTAKNLCSLIQLDIDAVRAYEQALKNIDHIEIKDTIKGFQQDHERHTQDLSEEVRKLGEKPPELTPDLKGFVLEGFTAIRSLTGTEGALKAMATNEKITNKNYEDALTWDMPLEIKEIVRKNYEDEKRHLSYINDAISRQLWKQTEQA